MSNLSRYHRLRAWALELLGGACDWCGDDEDLHIDHVDPALKTAHFTDLFKSGSMERVRVELENAQLLCRACHASKTSQDRRTLVMYAS